MEHLDTEARKAMEFDVQKRIEYALTSRFITYDGIQEIFDGFTDILNYPDDHRPPNAILISKTNNGKTALLQEFQRINDVKKIPGVGPQLKVLHVQAPNAPDESRLYTNILKALNAPVNGSDIVSNKLLQVERAFKSLGLKVLILDELHNVANATATKQRKFLTDLKFLCNEFKLSLICAGTQAAYDVLSYDAQVASRFERYDLPTWQAKPKEFVAFLKKYETMLPLKHSSGFNEDKKLIGHIFKLGEGTLGEYVRILKYSAREAIRSGEERITIDVINKIKFTPPSKR